MSSRSAQWMTHWCVATARLNGQRQRTEVGIEGWWEPAWAWRGAVDPVRRRIQLLDGRNVARSQARHHAIIRIHHVSRIVGVSQTQRVPCLVQRDAEHIDIGADFPGLIVIEVLSRRRSAPD